MYKKLLQDRLLEIRLANKKSERGLSLDLGHNSNYCNDIANGRALPSMSEFFYICEYFGITPKDFFDNDEKMSLTKQKAKRIIDQLEDSDIDSLMFVLEKFVNAHPPSPQTEE